MALHCHSLRRYSALCSALGHGVTRAVLTFTATGLIGFIIDNPFSSFNYLVQKKSSFQFISSGFKLGCTAAMTCMQKLKRKFYNISVSSGFKTPNENLYSMGDVLLLH
jgi:hypothetical protein